MLPIGVFWDIENLNVPKYKSASGVVERIREKFFDGFREAEFMCVCDINKENKDIIQELNSAQVNIVHIDATGKNAADDKIRQSLRRFSDTHPPNTRIILISGDFNFISDLSDLRYRKNYYTILVHGKFTNEALIRCANEAHLYDDIIDSLPFRTSSKGPEGKAEIEIRGYSKETPKKEIHHKLKQLSNNCGGRVVSVTNDYALLRFPTQDNATKAKKRMDGEKVSGFKIRASFPHENELTSASCTVAESIKKPIPRKFTSNKDFFEYSKLLDEGDKINQKTCSSSLKNTASIPIDIHSPGYQRKTFPSTNGFGSSELNDQEFTDIPDSFSEHIFADGKCNRNLLMIHQQRYQEQKQREQYEVYGNYFREFRPNSAPTRNSPGYVLPCMNGSPRSLYCTSPQNRAHSAYPSSYTCQTPNYNNCNIYDGPSLNRMPASAFQPIGNGYITNGSCSPSDYGNIEGPVELVVSNLDYNISAKEWRKILFTTFHPQVKVLSVHIKTQPDNTCIGMVKIPSVDEARFAISQFHRKKIGYKRIQVTLKHEEAHIATANLRSEAVALLYEANGNVLPLFKFIEQFDKRFHKNITISDLYKMKDAIEIHEHPGAGRFVYLASQNNPIRVTTPDPDMEVQEIFEHPVCSHHCPEDSVYYAEAMNCCMLPNVKLHMKPFSANVHTLLLSHNGSLPLISFTACYAAEFSPLVPVKENGVALEHLISSIPGIQITLNKIGMKKVQWSENTSSIPDSCRTITSPVLCQSLHELGNELVDLIKSCPQCRLPVSKFISAYSQYYGHQCRVADYGFTKLMDLFEALPHSVQVLGVGGRRILTLSHKSQIKIFTADLLTVLKWLPGKVMDLEDFPNSYVRVFGKPWDITMYGSCYLEDLITEVPSTAVTVYTEDDRMYLSIPRRDQAPEEIERTKQFAIEVYDLLKHNQGRISFSRFIPAYHHHFGRQCRVAEYGFTRLSDLLEAISHVVEVEDEDNERVVRLTLPEMRKVLSEQVTDVLKKRPGQCIPLHDLLPAFLHEYGFTPRFEDFNVECLKSLLSKLRHIIKVEVYNGEQYVVLLRHTQLPPLALQVLQFLMDQSSGSLPFVELCSWYRNNFNVDCDMKQIREELLDYVQVSGEDNSAVISLTKLQVLARDIRLLLIGHGKIPLDQLEACFKDAFGVDIMPSIYGFPSLQALLYALPHIVIVRGKGLKKVLQLSKQLKVPSAIQQTAKLLTGNTSCNHGDIKNDSDTPSNDSGVTDTHEEDLLINEEKTTLSPIDLLCGGAIPSNIPSPVIRPSSQGLPDLMSFTTVQDTDYLVITDEERRNLRTPLCQTPTSQILQFAAQCLPETKEGNNFPPRSQTTSPHVRRWSKPASPIPILGQGSSPNVSSNSSPVMRLLQGVISPKPSRSPGTMIYSEAKAQSLSPNMLTTNRCSPVQMNLLSRSYSKSEEWLNSNVIQQGSRKSDTLDVVEGQDKSAEFGNLLKGGWWKASPTQLEEMSKTFKLPSESWSGRSTPVAPEAVAHTCVDNSKSVTTDVKPKCIEKDATSASVSEKLGDLSAGPKIVQSLSKSLSNLTELAKPMATNSPNEMDSTFDQSLDTTLDSEMSYNLLFKRGHPLDTSSVRSYSSSPRKSRRPRIAARFNIPIEQANPSS